MMLKIVIGLIVVESSTPLAGVTIPFFGLHAKIQII
jgi:hypothetical protein